MTSARSAQCCLLLCRQQGSGQAEGLGPRRISAGPLSGRGEETFSYPARPQAHARTPRHTPFSHVKRHVYRDDTRSRNLTKQPMQVLKVLFALLAWAMQANAVSPTKHSARSVLIYPLQLYFYLDPKQTKCFYEELPADTVVVGHYMAEAWDQDARQFTINEDIGMGIEIHVSIEGQRVLVTLTSSPLHRRSRNTTWSQPPLDHRKGSLHSLRTRRAIIPSVCRRD